VILFTRKREELKEWAREGKKSAFPGVTEEKLQDGGASKPGKKASLKETTLPSGSMESDGTNAEEAETKVLNSNGSRKGGICETSGRRGKVRCEERRPEGRERGKTLDRLGVKEVRQMGILHRGGEGGTCTI